MLDNASADGSADGRPGALRRLRRADRARPAARQGGERLRADGAQPRALPAAAERGLRAHGGSRQHAARAALGRAARGGRGSAHRRCAGTSSNRRPGGSPACSARSPARCSCIAALTVQSTGDEVREVGWVQSAGMMVRRAAYEQVGAMDPDFFVYSDEVDWQKPRARRGLVGAVRARRDDRAPRAALARRRRAAADRRVLAQPRPLHAQAPRAGGGRGRARADRVHLRAARDRRAGPAGPQPPPVLVARLPFPASPAAARDCERPPRRTTESWTEEADRESAHRLPHVPDLAAARVGADHRGRAGGGRRGRHRGGHGARLGDAHHRRACG